MIRLQNIGRFMGWIMDSIDSLNVEKNLKFKIVFFLVDKFFKLLPNTTISRLLLFSGVRYSVNDSSSNNFFFSILVVHSPGGDLDLMAMVRRCSRPIQFIFFSKQLFDLIYKKEFNRSPSDYNVVQSDLNLGNRLSKISDQFLKSICKRYPITHYIQFNFIYRSLWPMRNFCFKQGLPVIHLYKECFRTEGTLRIFRIVLPKVFSASKNEHFLVHNREIAQLLIEAEVCLPGQIVVTGQGRSDFLWSSKKQATHKIKPTVTFFTIAPKSGLPNFELADVRPIDPVVRNKLNSIDLSIYNEPIIQELIKLSRKLGFFLVVKGKFRFWSSVEDAHDVKFLSGPPDLNLIIDSDVVIGCNSTCLIEGAIANSKVISFKPSELVNSEVADFFHDLSGCAEEVGSVDELCSKVEDHFDGDLSTSGKIVSLETKKRLVEKFLGNSDGLAGQRILETLERIK